MTERTPQPPSPRPLGALFRLRPRANLAALHQTAPGQTWGPRTISDSQLIYVVAGRAQLQLGPHTIDARRGDALFYGADSPHRIVSSPADPFTFVSIHFSWDEPSPEPVHPGPGIRTCDDAALVREPVAYTVSLEGYGDVDFPHVIAAADLEDLFLSIVREFNAKQAGYATALCSLMMQVLVGLARRRTQPSHSAEALAKVRPALEAIEDNPAHDWRVRDLARLCGYHPTYFAALFQQGAGVSPKRFLCLERVRLAQTLLLTPDSIETVAERAGFGSVHYFCRVFKAETHLTPTEFRRSRAVM